MFKHSISFEKIVIGTMNIRPCLPKYTSSPGDVVPAQLQLPPLLIVDVNHQRPWRWIIIIIIVVVIVVIIIIITGGRGLSLLSWSLSLLLSLSSWQVAVDYHYYHCHCYCCNYHHHCRWSWRSWTREPRRRPHQLLCLSDHTNPTTGLTWDENMHQEQKNWLG